MKWTLYRPNTTAIGKTFVGRGLCHTLRLILALTYMPVIAAEPVERKITVAFNNTETATVSFSQTVDQFTLLTLPTHGLAYSLSHTSQPISAGDSTPPVQQISSDAFFTMETRLLLTAQDCQQCEITVIRAPSEYSPSVAELSITSYQNDGHRDRLAAEKYYRLLFSDGLFDDLLVDAGQTAKRFTALNTADDKLRACELDLFRVNESLEASAKVAKRCAALAEKLNKPHLVNLFTVEQARYFWHMDKTDAAIANLTQVLEQNQASGSDVAFVNANAELLLGMIHNKKGEYASADEYFQRAAEQFDTLGEKTLMTDALVEQGLSLRFRNQMTKAAKVLERAYGVSQAALRHYDYQTANIKYNMAIVSALSGQYYHAWRLIDSLQSYADNGATPLWRAHILAAKARIIMELGRLDEAEALYQEVWHLYEKLGANSHLATVANNLANLYIDRGDFEQARNYLEQANQFWGSQWGEEQNLRIRQARVNYYQANDDIEAALAELAAMAPMVEASNDNYRHGRFLSQKANAQILQQQFEPALRTLERALVLHKKANDDLASTRSHYLTAVALYRAQKPLQQISEHLEQAIGIIESKRSQMTDDRVRQEYFALQKNIYELAIRANLTLEDQARILTGLHHAENFRARTLYENLLQKTAIGAEDGEGTLLKSSFDIFANKPTAEQLPKLSFTQLQQYQQALPSGDALLYFFVGEEQSYVWFIAAGQVKMQLLPAAHELNEQILPLVELMDQRPSTSTQASPWQSLVASNRQVSDLLLGPLADQLNGVNNLTVIPDGVLHRLPFAYLLDPNASKPAPIIASTNIRYASSIATDNWLNREKPSSQHAKGILLVANPKLTTDSTAVAALRDGNGLGNLPFAEKEADALMKLWRQRGDSYLLARENATKQNFTQSTPNDYQVVHFAGHATINWDNPALSAIKLSPGNDLNDNSLNGADLTLSDIAQLELNSELVVLSACETAAGKLTTGEGPIGLSRAFFEAGSARVLASLWPVDDTATALLLEYFYQALLQEQLAPAQALRSAQLKMLQNPDYFHPFYWAGFIFIGKNAAWLGQQNAANSTAITSPTFWPLYAHYSVSEN
ncbi:CHAT domain-containing protein [Halioxenophilus aromaticivorans]|uniref:CHAT domain-containing protein n=1 Tax=Halioxenophilus aromaticivorans TaxID=1306992 RepID=UPI0031E6DEE4